MKKTFITMAAACCTFAVAPFLNAETHVSVDLGLRLAPPPPVVVRRAPPRPMQERMLPSPGPGYVWIAGHNTWRNNDWVWEPGVWVRQPREGAVWVEPRWDERSQTWIDGYWNVQGASYQTRGDDRRDDRRDDRNYSDNDRDREVVVVEAPPPPRHEVRIARPGRDFVWIEGYWVRRHRRYEWVPGHWERPPHGHGRWQGPRWERRGGNYVFIEGSWR